MSMRIPQTGLPQLLKEGYKHYSGLEEAVFRNINACKELSNIVRTSLGPNGRNKMVINHLEKLFVTNDAATIIRELEVVHPAAKMLVMASQQQEQEMGDQSNFVVVLAGELLAQAEYLLRMGLHPSEVISGYDVAAAKALEFMEQIAASTPTVADPKKAEELIKPVRTAIAAKQCGYEDLLAPLVVQAALEIMPKEPKGFNTDSVRVVKILGGSIYDTRVVRGMVFGREAEGDVKRTTKAKVAVFSCALDAAMTETKGTVLLHNAGELLNFSKGEESALEKTIREVAESGAKILVSGSSVGDLALHFCNRYGLLVMKITSKFELRRLCRVTGATPLTRVGTPMPEELGFVDVCETIEIGSDRCTVFRQEEEATRTATIIIRGGTTNILDDLERAVDDGVNVVKAVCKDNRLLPGAGAAEMELANMLVAFGEKTPGLNQYAIKKFGEALEVIPRTLADNAGMDSTEFLANLAAAHAQGQKFAGCDIDSENNGTLDAVEKSIFDVLAVKHWALKLAADATRTILSVDQIIMSKPAGGPKQPKQDHWDEDD